jgi:hypothetical protein
MSGPTLERVIAGIQELAGKGLIDLYPPITAQALGWIQERFRTQLQRELPAELATLLQVSDGCQINNSILLGSKGALGLVDHNVELRAHGGAWLPGHVVFGTSGNNASYVIDVDAHKFHVSDFVSPRFLRSFKTFPELLREIVREQLGIKARAI